MKSKKPLADIDPQTWTYCTWPDLQQNCDSQEVDTEGPEMEAGCEGCNQKMPKIYAKCKPTCKMQKFWALKLHATLQKLDPDKNLTELRENFVLLETCKFCWLTYPLQCNEPDKCSDTIWMLRHLEVHFSGTVVVWLCLVYFGIVYPF